MNDDTVEIEVLPFVETESVILLTTFDSWWPDTLVSVPNPTGVDKFPWE